MGIASLAIWNKNRVITAIAAGAWVIRIIFEIQCKLIPSVEVQAPH